MRLRIDLKHAVLRRFTTAFLTTDLEPPAYGRSRWPSWLDGPQDRGYSSIQNLLQRVD